MRHIDHAIYASVHRPSAAFLGGSANLLACAHSEPIGLMDSLQIAVFPSEKNKEGRLRGPP
jgi:hypothetical protein